MEFYKYCKNMFQHFTILCVCKTLKRKTDSFLNTHAYNWQMLLGSQNNMQIKHPHLSGQLLISNPIQLFLWLRHFFNTDKLLL